MKVVICTIQVKKAQSHGSPDYLNFKCEGLEDGFYADRLRGCHQYYVCKEGEKTTHFCKQAGHIFNEDLWACVPGTSYSCPAMDKRSLVRPTTYQLYCQRKAIL